MKQELYVVKYNRGNSKNDKFFFKEEYSILATDKTDAINKACRRFEQNHIRYANITDIYTI